MATDAAPDGASCALHLPFPAKQNEPIVGVGGAGGGVGVAALIKPPFSRVWYLAAVLDVFSSEHPLHMLQFLYKLEYA